MTNAFLIMIISGILFCVSIVFATKHFQAEQYSRMAWWLVLVVANGYHVWKYNKKYNLLKQTRKD